MNNITPFPTGNPLTAAEFNLRFAEIDAAIKKNNYAATGAPGTGDDSQDGYTVGSRWIDTTAQRVYIATSVAAGSAVWKEITTPAAISATSVSAATITATSKIYINDSSNAFQTIGLTVNQGANSDTILSLRSTAFSHGMTALANLNTFLGIEKISGGAGGAMFIGYSSATAALRFRGRATTEDATRTTAAQGYLSFSAQLRSGTNVVTPSADKNLAVFKTGDLTRFIFTTNGDSWEDGTGWTAFDSHDDIALLNMLNDFILAKNSNLAARDVGAMESAKDVLGQLNLVSAEEGSSPFANRSKIQELSIGAVRQLGEQLNRLNERITRLEKNT